jgi:RimJ/RimL family protein N-acetyltransferase
MDLDIVLENERAQLQPLTMKHLPHLMPIASQAGLIRYSPSNIASPEALQKYIEMALEDKAQATALPFVIYDKQRQAYAGSTRYMHIDARNRVLHIGSTWIGREFQGTGLNGAVKQLLLHHAFFTMGFEKVEFRVDERNLASRKAVEKLGCALEGILRQNVYLTDGFKRNTCCYGLLRSEWPLPTP